ncbi:MAG: HAMP domain-containing protein, partial [Candidatus Krumholzibacteriia bacterium]
MRALMSRYLGLFHGSLARQIVGPTAVVVVALMTLSTVSEWILREKVVRDKLREEVTETGATLDAALRHAMSVNDGEAVSKMVARVGEMGLIRRVSLLDAAGKIAQSSDKTLVGGGADKLLPSGATLAAAPSRLRKAEGGRPFMQVVAPIPADDSCLGCHSDLKRGDATGYLVLDRWADRDLKTARISQVRQALSNLLLIGLLVGVLVWAARAITRPVAAIAGSAARIARGDLSQEIGHRSDDEIGALADSFRDLTGYLQEMAGGAKALSEGDLSVRVAPRSEQDVLARNFAAARAAIEGLIAETSALTTAAREGRLTTRGDAARFQGGYRQVVEGVNEVLDALTGLLDNMPTPAMIIDKDFTIRYMNDIGAKVGGRTRDQVIGQKCHDFFRTSDCRTSRCACGQAMAQGHEASSDTDAHPNGLDLDIHYSGIPIRDGKGNVIGAFEVVTDQTAVRQAARMTQKVADYQTAETRKLTAALTQMASGDLSAQVELAAADADTTAARELLQQILAAMHTLKQAVVRLVDDANLLATAAVEGRLDTRADVARHQGDFRRIVAGVNATLDAVLTPIKEASDVLETLSNYDLRARVAGDYKGDHAKIKESLNRTAQALHDSLAQVSEAVEQVTSASGQIASSSQQVAEGASEQASSLEETSSSLEEMSSMTKQNADNTQQAKALTEATKGAADRGAASMGQMMTAMGRIRTASEGTAQIIRDINEIAFQT